MRMQIAALLRTDGVSVANLYGGIYPTIDADDSFMSEGDYPAAFAADGSIRPCALVRDEGAFPFGDGTVDNAASAIFSVLFWQQKGHDHIEAALERTRAVLRYATVNTGGTFTYRLEWAGDGPITKDQGIRDAEHSWSRWQAIQLQP